jgi:hypothetical protein
MDPFSQLRDELVKDILNIQGPFYSNAITALIFLAFFLFITYTIVILIRDHKKEKERKKKRLDFERTWIKLFNKEGTEKKNKK